MFCRDQCGLAYQQSFCHRRTGEKKKEKKGDQQWCVEDTFGLAYLVESLVFSSIAQKKKKNTVVQAHKPLSKHSSFLHQA